MTKRAIVSLIALALVVVFAAVSQTPAAPKHHVVFQLTEPEGPEWGTLIRHVNNLREAFAKDGGSEVEVVFFWAGTEYASQDPTPPMRSPALSAPGVLG